MLKFFKPAFALMLLVLGSSAFAADTPGVTPSEIKVGGIFPFSGPASSIGLTDAASSPTCSRSTTAAA